MKQFKARCSSIGKIVNLTSLTDKQLEDVAKYSLREHIIGKGELTDNQTEELNRLKAKIGKQQDENLEIDQVDIVTKNFCTLDDVQD